MSARKIKLSNLDDNKANDPNCTYGTSEPIHRRIQDFASNSISLADGILSNPHKDLVERQCPPKRIRAFGDAIGQPNNMEVTSKMLIRFITLVVFAFGFGVSGAMAADADLKKGKKVFKKCAACHTVVQKKHKIGPSLAGVMGRTAGTIEGFKYSKAMRAYGKSGIVWSEETLDAYLLNPRKAVKGTKMVFPGLKKAKDRAAVIAYLKSLNE